MRLLVEQAQVEDQEQKDNYGKNTKKDGLPFTLVSEKGEEEYVHQ